MTSLKMARRKKKKSGQKNPDNNNLDSGNLDHSECCMDHEPWKGSRKMSQKTVVVRGLSPLISSDDRLISK